LAKETILVEIQGDRKVSAPSRAAQLFFAFRACSMKIAPALHGFFLLCDTKACLAIFQFCCVSSADLAGAQLGCTTTMARRFGIGHRKSMSEYIRN
jgi:hypothetical protein